MKRWLIVVILILIVFSVRIFAVTLDNAIYHPPEEHIEAVAGIPVSAAATTTARRAVPKPTGRLIIPSISVSAGIEKVGVNAKGNIASPSTFQTVAWYTGSAKLGEQGLSIVDGHVNNGLGLNGVFANLEQVKIGDDIYIDVPTGPRLHYKVQNISYFDYTARADDLQATGGAQLALVTCTGDWLPNQKTYDKRMVVLATLI